MAEEWSPQLWEPPQWTFLEMLAVLSVFAIGTFTPPTVANLGGAAPFQVLGVLCVSLLVMISVCGLYIWRKNRC